MAEQIEINVKSREVAGRAASRKSRRAEEVPAVVYGAGKANENVILPHNIIYKMLEEGLSSHVLDLIVDDKKAQKVVVKDAQYHPYKPVVMHVDFMRVKASDPIDMVVPVHFIGADVAPGVKEGGIVHHLLSELHIRCLPKALPDHLTVDLTNAEMNHIVHLSDIELPKGVELLSVIHGEEDHAVASITPPPVAEPEPEVEAEAALESEEEAAEESAAEETPEGETSEES